jgi:release factor glutamine methyltransferase
MATAGTLHSCIQDARRRLERTGIEAVEAAIDADVLARHALGGWERGQLLARLREACPPGFAADFEPLVRRREHREPTGYITGHREFWSIEIEVGPGVLIPRPETEFIVEEVLARVTSGAEGPRLRIADVGTGSGCLAVALARWLPGAHVLAIDVSEAALRVARRNAARHEVGDRVVVLQGNLLQGTTGLFDVIVSNPPYVPAGDLASLQPEIREFEPVGALDGGQDGLDLVRRLVPEAAARLVPGGWLAFEFGFGQSDGVRAIIANEPRLDLVDVRADLAGIPRVAVARRRAADSESRVSNPEPRIPDPMSCLFCRIIAGELPAKRIFEDETLVAFHDVNPQAPVHVLVVPRRHIATLNDLGPGDDALVGALLRRAAVLAHELGIAGPGYRAVFNCNREAGQTVYHIHLHVLGGRPMRWPPG